MCTEHPRMEELANIIVRMIESIEQHKNSSFPSVRFFSANQQRTRGRPVYVISREQLEFFIEAGFTRRQMADLLHVSDSSVKRRLRSFGLKLRQTYSVLSNNALDDLVREVTQGNPSLGQRMVQGLLQSRGHRVQRQRVADSLIRVDAAAVALRWCHSIRRRVYKVAAPNSLWHIDGNHKLIRPVTTSEELTQMLREQARTCIRQTDEDPLTLEVRRNFVLRDALQYIRVSQEDLHSPLHIRFLGEQGIDLGGLRREFWTLFLYQVSHSTFITGRPGRLAFQKNFIEQRKRTFYYLGQLVALSVLQDGPGLPIFSDIVTDYILDRDRSVVSEGDLPEHLAQLIEQMKEADSDAAAQTLFQQMFDEACTAGFLIPSTSFNKSFIPALVGALVNNLVESSRVELDQFVDGLKTHQVLELLRLRPDDSYCIFSGRTKPVTVEAVRLLLHFRYRTGNHAETDQQTAQGFLTFLRATKGSTASVNGVKLQPNDVLMWLTGSATMPAVGFHKVIDVEFGDTLRVNTCALVLTLAEVPREVEDVVQHYSELLINSQTFQAE
ncbi:uncharacterized protein LOC127850897 isoform X3 [Dreissena polymorpha]|uniref:uncharacterized protein LOC127850897 isoform X3 n=1 Tax=Dreissena polymorpha TaxID=45954 RepID=UPI002263D4CE|nr:uncharacterized protein LOC127850897 isoform X3 [Dreissena polymorpha]